MTKPNILVLMADQVNGTLFEDGPADFLHMPNVKALAERSVRFRNAYTPSYLCAPGRAAFMSGQLPPVPASTTTLPSFRRAFRPGRTTCGALATKRVSRARCTSSARISYTASSRA